MLHNLDAAADSALRSFSDALAQAQQTLQQDQKRLNSTQTLLQSLTHANAELRTGKVHNTLEQQRLDALRSEKAKLSRQLQNKRDHIQRCRQHIQKLKEPRLRLLETLDGLRHEVKALRKSYCVRAAHIHAYVAQFLLPQNSLASLQAQLQRVQKQRAEREAAVLQLQQAIRELDAEAAVLKEQTNLAAKARVLENEEANTKSADDAGEKKEKRDTSNNNNTAGATPDSATKVSATHRDAEEDAAGTGALDLSSPQRWQRLLSQRAEQQQKCAEAKSKFQADEAALQQRRADLKKTVLQLCHAIEEADAAQQAEQRAYNDCLNAAVSSGASRSCVRCHQDFLDGFA